MAKNGWRAAQLDVAVLPILTTLVLQAAPGTLQLFVYALSAIPKTSYRDMFPKASRLRGIREHNYVVAVWGVVVPGMSVAMRIERTNLRRIKDT
jgi:hypothetical protein